MNTKPSVEINAPGVDAQAIVQEIQDAVAQKTKDGVYTDARVARAERTNLINLKDDKEFLSFYLNALREAAFVDINDFDIRERRSKFAPLIIKLKQTIWKLLKFYTYRMWSQQNTVNGLFVTGLESMHEQNTQKVEQLEARIAELEKKLNDR